jgi:hypothetical protein
MPQRKTILLWIPLTQIYKIQNDIRIKIYLHNKISKIYLKLLESRTVSKPQIRLYTYKN